MNPEERAAAHVAASLFEHCHPLPCPACEAEAIAAAAIREAVDAETEACAAFPAQWALSQSCTHPEPCEHQRTAATIEQWIRQRAASRAKPAPGAQP